jgi:hypothetical protein
MLGRKLQRLADGRRGGVTQPLMTRSLIASVTLAAVLALPVGAHAQSSLLSGYGGPGGGEQVLLGGKLLPAKRGDGGLRAASAPRTSAPRLTVGPATAGTAAAAATTTDPAAAGSRSKAQASRPSTPAATSTRHPSAAAANTGHRSAAAAQRRAARTPRGTDAPPGGLRAEPIRTTSPQAASPGSGGLPFTARDLILLALIAIVLPLTAIAAQRLSRGSAPEPSV